MEAPQAPDLTCRINGAIECPRADTLHTHTAVALWERTFPVSR